MSGIEEAVVTVCDWHRIDIVAALHKRGLTMRGLSEKAGLRPDTLKNALDRSYPKGERIIAQALDTKPQNIWPSRYNNKKGVN
ncbi:helix-turn-helix domain-containing protein [Klebsiella oxytoca]|uniref:helix-turn-helix domain-containing protein n=1 Tax=Klebsiella oxytoca TaxID=571 RepID=UPI003A90E4A4